MKKNRLLCQLLMSFPFISMAAASHAQTATSGGSQWGLGIGGLFQDSPYKGYGLKSQGAPLVLYDSHQFHFAGSTLDWKLASLGDSYLGLRAKYANDGYHSGDAPILNGMASRKGGIWLGSGAVLQGWGGKLQLEVLTATGSPEGTTARLDGERTFRASMLGVTPHAGIDWMSDKYVDYYFGVRDSEVTLFRPAYAGKSSLNTNAGVRMDISFTKHQNISIDLGAVRYGSGVTDSPLVDRSSTPFKPFAPFARLGYLYLF